MAATTPTQEDGIAPKKQKNARGWLITLVKVLVSGGLLTWFFLTQNIDWSELWALLRGIDLFYFGCAVVSWVFLLALGGWRWALLLRAVGVQAGIVRCVQFTLSGVFFATISFGPLAADGMRTWWASREFNGKLMPIILSLIADRLAGLIGLGVICLCLFPPQWALLMSRADTAVVLGLVVLILGGSLGAVFFSVLFRDRPNRNSPAWLARVPFVEQRRELSAAVGAYWDRPQTFFGALAISILIQFLTVVSGVFTLMSLKIDFSLLYGATLVPLVNVLQSLPITVMGFGVRESTVAVLFANISESSAPALAFALLNLSINLVGAAVGLFFWLGMRERKL